MVADMDRVRLDRFTRETWKKFDAKDLEPLKWAILRRRRVLAAPMRPSALGYSTRFQTSSNLISRTFFPPSRTGKMPD